MKCHICYKISLSANMKTFEVEGKKKNICPKCQKTILLDALKNIRIIS